MAEEDTSNAKDASGNDGVEQEEEPVMASVVEDNGSIMSDDAAQASATTLSRGRRSNGSRRASPQQRIAVIRHAQAVLHETAFPAQLSDGTVVHALGKIEPHKEGFCTTDAIYSSGFCCDRLMFSPVHGRNVLLRCSILDPSRVQRQQKRSGFRVDNSLPKKGPLFRIVWGRGVEEGANRDDENDPDGPPRPRQIVRVQFSDQLMVFGTVLSVNIDMDPIIVTVLYNDGSKEEFNFPDPDLNVVKPGTFTH